MTEQHIRQQIINRDNANGWYVIKLLKTNKNGIPDLLCLKSGEHPLFIEVKTETGKLSRLQEYRIDELKKAGFDAMVLRT